MNNQELTLLSVEQIWGNSQLEVLKKYGTKIAATDLCILTRGCVRDEDYVDEDKSLTGRTCVAWTKTVNKYVKEIFIDGLCSCCGYINDISCVIRPVLQNSTISLPSTVSDPNIIMEIEYGEYPQNAPSATMQKKLEKEYKKGMNKTGRSYTFSSSPCDDFDTLFKPITYDEYEYHGKKYIRVRAIAEYPDYESILSNGLECKDGDYFWVQVSPVKWLIDDKTGLLISKKGLVAGIGFGDVKYYDGMSYDFDKSELKKYLDTHMMHDLFQNTVSLNVSNIQKHHIKSIQNHPSQNQPTQVTQQNSSTQDVKVEDTQAIENKSEYDEVKQVELQVEKRKNPYDLNFNKVSEEDIIKGAVESGVAVFLHGPSSEGKSARVKQIDPTCEIIYLRNATPESLNGKSVYNQQTGEMIDVQPTWLKKLQEKCKNEPDRYHIVFFDEITNALPSIQGIAFNIVLDREVNGIWKLPENARIVAAGNDMKDSLAANQLAEPLFNRFAHVYIKTTTESWLNWASEYNIHPAIYTFIAYTKGAVLRSGYNGEKPNADPRKWEMASKMLYSTRNPEMLRALVGEDITKEFVAFCNQEVITLNDVINENYNYRDIEVLNTAERYATIIGLTQVDEENLEKVRDFAISLGAEFGAIFDSLWVHGDESRLEKLAEIKLAGGGLRR
jgi:ATPase associated with various cellular activities AAA_3